MNCCHFGFALGRKYFECVRLKGIQLNFNKNFAWRRLRRLVRLVMLQRLFDCSFVRAHTYFVPSIVYLYLWLILSATCWSTCSQRRAHSLPVFIFKFKNLSWCIATVWKHRRTKPTCIFDIEFATIACDQWCEYISHSRKIWININKTKWDGKRRNWEICKHKTNKIHVSCSSSIFIIVLLFILFICLFICTHCYVVCAFFCFSRTYCANNFPCFLHLPVICFLLKLHLLMLFTWFPLFLSFSFTLNRR